MQCHKKIFCWNHTFSFFPRVPYSVSGFYFMYNIRQDAGIRTRVAATAAMVLPVIANGLHEKEPGIRLSCFTQSGHNALGFMPYAKWRNLIVKFFYDNLVDLTKKTINNKLCLTKN